MTAPVMQQKKGYNNWKYLFLCLQNSRKISCLYLKNDKIEITTISSSILAVITFNGIATTELFEKTLEINKRN